MGEFVTSLVRKIGPAAHKRAPPLGLVYGTASTKFGNCLAAFQRNALCYLTFYDTEPPLEGLRQAWPNATLYNDILVSENIVKLFEGAASYDLFLKGTDFELEVWEALLKVKKGKTASYEDIARAVGRPRALRAVGRAVGKNPVAYVVPCHRIIRKDGAVYKYASGAERKRKLLEDEGAI
ncbi:bifunctional transcriptional activator/DNA repair enzyme Ada [Tribolium castaneum]|uniref:Methylated-DNA--protein-cysteine methyltransferase n=1 Tax=Tribolium castaneum TaxID=7070 RepID=D2A5R7_TRICA|nr:PREDICTED: bifunctional transcriptional activator/DNA repair enzyme Ada [Tribolium castaneum]EFA05409.1 Bifunctional transcriptional activator/DNA repair enzyme Ada-like Protein [Tribolium castaneum]|eukprot:XP_973367.1 PREDICTED: bifunctional transcriptional activator/DNA repair enzyme Ada [Tribolium castaneum]